MDRSLEESTARVGRTLGYELNLIREAIAMVASGGAPRVTVAGLRYGERLLGAARDVATAAGVRLVPLWIPDDAGADIAVERIVDE